MKATEFKDKEGGIRPGIKSWLCHWLTYDIKQVTTYVSFNLFISCKYVLDDHKIGLMSTFPTYTLKFIKMGTRSNMFIALSSFNLCSTNNYWTLKIHQALCKLQMRIQCLTQYLEESLLTKFCSGSSSAEISGSFLRPYCKWQVHL